MIQDILQGKKNFDFAVEMSIPTQTYSMFKERHYFDAGRREIFSRLRNMLVCYFEQGDVLGDEMSTQIELVMCLNHQDKVVFYLLEEYVLRFLNVLFKNSSADLGVQKNLKLYAQNSEQNIIAERLISYLDCYIGYRNFQLFVAYKDGESNIFITV